MLTANKAFKRDKPRCWQRLLKRDAHGNYPEWWQWLFPRYGNYGAPGWSGGAWVDDPAKTDWSVAPVDALDAVLMQHDRDYQDGELWVLADVNLVAALHNLTPPASLHGRAYRIGAIVIFSIHVAYMLLFGRWNYLEPLSDEGN